MANNNKTSIGAADSLQQSRQGIEQEFSSQPVGDSTVRCEDDEDWELVKIMVPEDEQDTETTIKSDESEDEDWELVEVVPPLEVH